MGTGNTDNLRRATEAKKTAALARAEKGIRDLLRRGAPITFEAVASAGSISKGFLYANSDLRSRITMLRDQSDHAVDMRSPPREPGDDTSSVVRTLTTKLAAERASHRAELAELRSALEAAHGEILSLRRSVGQQ